MKDAKKEQEAWVRTQLRNRDQKLDPMIAAIMELEWKRVWDAAARGWAAREAKKQGPV